MELVSYQHETKKLKPKQFSSKPLSRIGLFLAALCVLSFPASTFAWGSSETLPDNTHRRIVRQAADLLDENIDRYGDLQAANDILQWHMDQLEEGGVAPDYNQDTPYYIGADLLCQRFGRDCRAGNLYSDHFYDGDSHEGLRLSSVMIYNSNFLAGPLGDLPPENAESQTRRYVGIALATWKDAVREQKMGNTEKADALFGEAVYWLGYASHYFSDLMEPHHAANYPWGPLNRSHSEFEHLVDEQLDEFLPEGEIRPNTWNYGETNQYASITILVTDYANTYSKKAKSYLKDCIHGYFRGFPRNWKNAAGIMTRASRDVLSLLYYRFLTEVTEFDNALDESVPVGEFNLEIEMGDGFTPIPKKRNPGEEISFRIDFSNGQSKTWPLDTRNFFRWYSFNTDSNSSYFLDWTENLPLPSEVKSVRLVRGQNAGDKPWEVEHLSLFIHGIRVLDENETSLLVSGGEILFPVDGGLPLP